MQSVATPALLADVIPKEEITVSMQWVEKTALSFLETEVANIQFVSTWQEKITNFASLKLTIDKRLPLAIRMFLRHFLQVFIINFSHFSERELRNEEIVYRSVRFDLLLRRKHDTVRIQTAKRNGIEKIAVQLMHGRKQKRFRRRRKRQKNSTAIKAVL